jgi:hypothetical protein
MTSYDLLDPELGTQMNGITALPGDYVKAYINFCDPVTECSTTTDVYACLIDTDGGVLPLCSTQPPGGFIDTLHPQLGATYGCPPVKEGEFTYELNGVITSTNISHIYEVTGACTHCLDIWLFASVAFALDVTCISCGPSNIKGIGFAALYTSPTPAIGGVIGIDFVNPAIIYCDNSGSPA